MKKNYLLLIALLGTVSAFSQTTNSTTKTEATDSSTKPKSLNEVVIHSGYFKETVGGTTTAVTHIRGKDIQHLATQDIATALQGRVASLEVISASGQPGASAQITLRGPSSFSNVQPLYIVDGVKQPNGTNMNMADIESIDVLKDAAACAIYGADAAGGVIVITTKNGSESDDDQ